MGQPQIINLNGTDPAPPSGYQDARWQKGPSSGIDPQYLMPIYPVSCYTPNTGGVSIKTANYTATIADMGTRIVFNSSSAVTLTLPNPIPNNALTPPSVETRWNIQVTNIGAGALTIDRNGLTIDGGTSNITLGQFQSVAIDTDGTNFFSGRGLGSGSGGGLNGATVKTAAYTATSGDNGKLLSFNASTAVTLTLPAAAPSSTWVLFVENIGANNLSLSPNGLTLDGSSSSVTIPPGNGLIVFTDGTNYLTMRGMSDKPVWFQTTVSSSPTAGQDCGQFIAPAACTFPPNFAAPNSFGHCDVNPTSSATFTIYKNGTINVGTFTINTSGAFTFATAGGAAISLNAGDWLTIIAPGTPDATLAGVGVMIVGSRATLASVLTPIQFFTWKGTYAGGTTYSVNDVVYFHGASYVCISPTTGNNPLNSTFWAMMADGWNFTGAYASGSQYYPNDLVSSSGSTYLCIAATIGNAPPNVLYWSLVAAAGAVTSVNSQTGAVSIVGAGAISVGVVGGNIQISGGGATFGPRASLPGTIPASGTEYVCSDSPYRYISDGTKWNAFINGVPVLEPSGFSKMAFGDTITLDTSRGGVRMPPSAAVAIYGQAAPVTTNWAICAGFIRARNEVQFTQSGIALWDNATGKSVRFNWFLPWNAGKGYELTKWSAFNTYSASYTVASTGGPSTVQGYFDSYAPLGGMVWLRINKVGTSLFFYLATDPWNTDACQVLTTSVTDYLSQITHVVGFQGPNASPWFLHWALG